VAKPSNWPGYLHRRGPEAGVAASVVVHSVWSCAAELRPALGDEGGDSLLCVIRAADPVSRSTCVQVIRLTHAFPKLLGNTLKPFVSLVSLDIVLACDDDFRP
jgi:hypothetical protein